MNIIRLVPLVLCILSSVLLVSCLHEPTESIVKDSRSDNLRTYQSLDSINYRVEATASLVEDDPASPGNMLFAIQETDASGNLKYLALNGRVIIQTLVDSVPDYTYEDGVGNDPTDDEIKGIKPLLNCSDIENEIDSPCMENVFLAGSLLVDWQQNDTDLIEPISNTAISVMKETWSLVLTEANEEYVVPDGSIPRLTTTTTRYISQSSKELNKGELFVHAYENKLNAAVNDWVSVLDVNENIQIAKVTSDLSPIKGTGINEYLVHDIYTGCDGASVVSDCLRVARAEKNMTYQVSQETRKLDNFGILGVNVIILSGRIDRAATAAGAVDLGYEVFTNCSPDLPGVAFERRYVSYTGSLAMFPDVGPIQMNFSCNAFYDFSYNGEPGTVVTSINLNAKMDFTSIDLSSN